MQIFSLKNGICPVPEVPSGTVMIFGFFDGVHRGHTELIGKATEYARESGLMTCVWSFSSMPKSEKLLTTNDEKTGILAEIGIDYVVYEEFPSIKDTPFADFYEKYVTGKFAPAAVFCGFNFRFGRNAEGTADDLKALAEKNGVRGFVVGAYEADGDVVSSSRIRSLIAEGNVGEAAKLLGRPYAVNSCIVHGKEIGRRLGFATINQRIPPEKTVPKFGVYVTRAVFGNGNAFHGISNIGNRPTVNSDTEDVTLETHILDWDKNAYGEYVKLELMEFVRGEKKFESPEILAQQIGKDAKAARDYFALPAEKD